MLDCAVPADSDADDVAVADFIAEHLEAQPSIQQQALRDHKGTMVMVIPMINFPFTSLPS